jgi:hypothetical protein
MATAKTHVVTQTVNAGGGDVARSKSYSGSYKISMDEDVATAQTDFALNVDIDVSAVKSFFIVSDRNVLIQANDGSSPDFSINLIAGVPYIWTTDSYDTFLFTDDVTVLYVTNASGSTANIVLEALIDASP